MISFKRLFISVVLAVMCIIAVYAKETVIYENDFSNMSLESFKTEDEWYVSNGVLTLKSGSGSAYISYTIPEEYVGKKLRIEVDFLEFDSTGGITVGATGGTLAAKATDFFGYEGFTSSTGVKGAFGCYDSNGEWGGLVAVGSENIDVSDVHMTVDIFENTVVYKITSLDRKTKFFGIEYVIGESSLDVYNTFNGVFGLRRFYNGSGVFDNFKIIAIEDDEMPAMSKILTLGGVAYKASKNLFVTNNTLRGTGAMLTYNDLERNARVELKLIPVGVSKFFFGLDNLGNGFAFEIHKELQTVSLYRLEKYAYSLIGSRNIPIGDTAYSVYIDVFGDCATATFDVYSEGEDAFPTFDISLEGYSGRRFGFWLEGGSVKEISIGESLVQADTETYTNSLMKGADPDVLYYDGTYYYYRRYHSGDNIFILYTSPDLVNWTERNVVFAHDPSYETSSYMSPNVFYFDGMFYLFYAAKNASGQNRVYYATADTPYGPFTHKNGQVPIHDVTEIGGHPYYDVDSKKVYMTFVRFGSGNHIYIEEVKISNGVVTPVGETLTKVASPEFEYEINGNGAIVEGGVLYKHNGYYYMIYASGHYLSDYGEAYAVSKNILGPYTKYRYNDILSSTSVMPGVGDAVFVLSPDGKELYIMYHKHYSPDTVEMRQTCIDKVKFVKDPNGGPDILTVYGPTSTPQKIPSNIYRYDVNRDGETTLLDVLQTLKSVVENNSYGGRFDVNANGENDALDVLLVLKNMLE